jgi:hypothetical protein
MPTTVTHSLRRTSDHFEPEPALDPQEQRKLRGHLEQIDYAAYAANSEVVSQAFGKLDLARFQHLAVAAAHARSKWVAAAAAMAEATHALTPHQVSELAALRRAYEELAEVYEAMRRMVERGYLLYQAAPTPA